LLFWARCVVAASKAWRKLTARGAGTAPERGRAMDAVQRKLPSQD
jgi:hypothetical protein